MTTLISRNVQSGEGGRRTSMRLTPAFWDALTELCHRENLSAAALVGKIDAANPEQRTTAVRDYVLRYFRAAATDEGHAAAEHGKLWEPVE